MLFAFSLVQVMLFALPLVQVIAFCFATVQVMLFALSLAQVQALAQHSRGLIFQRRQSFIKCQGSPCCSLSA